jgi:hypothetical protein
LLTPPECFNPISRNKETDLLRVLGLDSAEGRKKVYNKRTRVKKTIFENYSSFIKLCERYKVDCPKTNSWVYKAFAKTSDESEEKSPVKMPRFKTTVDSKTKVLTSEGDILDEDYGKILECLIFFYKL